ncbi:MAG: ParB/RepB/Spo0J family partition protein [Pseudomonadota bacterium]
MVDRKEKRGLGRGLSALMAEVNYPGEDGPATEGGARKPELLVPVERVRPNSDQPRRDFDQSALEELANSIREKGVIQPLIVRADPQSPADYQIVAGERRWRAAQLAQIHELPVIVRDFDDTEVLEIAIIENIQRADLNPIEEALGFQQLQSKFGHTQEQLAQSLGKSRSHIANMLRLLNLPDAVISFVRQGKLSIGHARALITSDNPEVLAAEVMSKGLSVRQTEELARKPQSLRPAQPKKNTSTKDADTRALEDDLRANLSMKVSIDHVPGKERGVLTVEYKDFSELDELCRRLISL